MSGRRDTPFRFAFASDSGWTFTARHAGSSRRADAAEIRRLERIGCRAAVFVNVEPSARTSLRCASVFCDGAAVAEAAAELFARKRLRHFAYVGTREGDPWSAEREAALRRSAAERDVSFDAFPPPRGDRARTAREAAALARWAAGLPKPCGLLAANDIRAMDVLELEYGGATINPLGDWTGGTDVDTGATNRKLGSDMADSVTGGGLHGKDLSKADVSVNIHAFLKAQRTGEPVELSCAIGDDTVDGLPYSEIVETARQYINGLGGFEKFAEWGLVR